MERDMNGVLYYYANPISAEVVLEVITGDSRW